MADLSGKKLGKYTIDQKLAVGGMAEIYRAHTLAGEPVAIKVIHPRLAQESKFVQMFLDEAKIVSGLKHPNIVQVFDFGRVENTYYLSMEWIDGKPLSQVIQRQLEVNFVFPVDVALLITIDMLKGLHYAHTRNDRFDRPLNIIHRDISPPNILINRSGLSKVADFGIADAQHKVIETRPGIIRGKFSYMSPEQSKGEGVDFRSDVFSVGIVLHEMLSGRRLFLRSQDVDTITAVRASQIPSLIKNRKDVSEELERIIRKSLVADKNKRYRNAQEFASDLWFELKRMDIEITHQTVAQFLKVLFPWETFVGANNSLKDLHQKFKESGKAHARVIERKGNRNREYVRHALIGLGCLGFAELLAQWLHPW